MESNIEKMIFLDAEIEEKWEELPKENKDFILKNLKYTADKMCNKAAIEMLCQAVNELITRIEQLEKNT